MLWKSFLRLKSFYAFNKKLIKLVLSCIVANTLSSDILLPYTEKTGLHVRGQCPGFMLSTCPFAPMPLHATSLHSSSSAIGPSRKNKSGVSVWFVHRF